MFEPISEETLFSRFFGSTDVTKFRVSLRKPRNCFTLDDLDADSVVVSSSQSVRFEPCTFTVSQNELQATIPNKEINAMWSWPLDNFGRLPNTVKKRLDLDGLYTKIESDQTVVAKFEPANGQDSQFISNDGNWYLKQFE